MKVCMSSWSDHLLFQAKEMDQMSWVRHCKELGLDGVELLDIHFPNLSKEYMTGLKKLITDLGLEIPLCSVSNDFGKADPAARMESEKLVEKWIQFANWFGSRMLRVLAGWPGAHDPARYEAEKKQLWPEMIQSFQRLAKKAEESNVILVLENHNHLGFTRTVDDLFRILNEVGSDWLRFCLDTGDYLVDTAQVNGFPALEKALIYAMIIHAKFYEVDENGKDKKQDWDKILKILSQARYDGYLSIEYEGKDPKLEVPLAAKFLVEKTLLT